MIMPKRTAGGDAAHVQQLRKARDMIRALHADKNCMPIMLRLAWHDAGTYNQGAALAGAWPSGNGAVGTIRLDKEANAGPNAGLKKAVGYLKTIKEACPLVSWADLIQMGGAEGVMAAGGPRIDMIYGRMDAAATPSAAEEPFGLPDALPEFGGPPAVKNDPAAHLRYVFNKFVRTRGQLSSAHPSLPACVPRSLSLLQSFSLTHTRACACALSLRSSVRPFVLLGPLSICP